MGGQREAWLQGLRDTRREGGTETGGAAQWEGGGQQGQLPCSGDGTKQCQQSLKDCLALFLQSTGIVVLVAPGKLARGCW